MSRIWSPLWLSFEGEKKIVYLSRHHVDPTAYCTFFMDSNPLE